MTTTTIKLLSCDEVAEIVGLCSRSIRNHIERGDLRAIRFGRRCIRVLESDLHKWIESRSTISTQNNLEANV